MKLVRIVRRVGKQLVNAVPVLRRQLISSTDYSVLESMEDVRRAAASAGGWLSARTVKRQENAYRSLITAMNRGNPRLDLQVAVEAVGATGIEYPRLLEVGCGSGYYSEVFGTLLSDRVCYTGIDYSEAMIARARAQYPLATFEVADATRLPFKDEEFDIVFNGVSLMHIVDYQVAIRESARVAGRHCIFHSLPVFDSYRTTFLTKYAYGAPVVEVIFDAQEFLSLCQASGLRLLREWVSIPYDVSRVTGHRSCTKTYLFSR